MARKAWTSSWYYWHDQNLHQSISKNCKYAESELECFPFCGCQRKRENESSEHVSKFLMRPFFCRFLRDFLITRGVSRTPLTSKMELSLSLINDFQPLTSVTKNSILDDTGVRDVPLDNFVKYFWQIECFMLQLLWGRVDLVRMQNFPYK